MSGFIHYQKTIESIITKPEVEPTIEDAEDKKEERMIFVQYRVEKFEGALKKLEAS